ncbi:MAG: ABC transporter permease [Bryobacteraceae bacterium]
MKPVRAWLLRFGGVFRKRKRERELADELNSHLDLHTSDNLRSGMTPGQARREALLKLGGIEVTKEAYRDRSTIPTVESVLRDIRFAIRQLRRSPGFTSIATLMLSLGLCASAALFAFVDAALLRPLPYPNPNRLVHVTERNAMIPRADLSYLDFLDWRKMNRVFSSLDAYTGGGYLLNSGGGAEPVRGERVSDGFFRTLGIKPVMGRDFYAGEDLKGTPNTVILSFGAWQKRFGAAKNIIGQIIRLSGAPYTVIGVLPATFQFAPRGEAEIWTPLHASGSCEDRRTCHNMEAIARLKDGISVQAALANMTSIAQQLEAQYPDSNRGQWASVLPLHEVVVGEVRPILLVLLAGGILLLLIAYVNVANLLLARSEGRRREIAIRRSMGASSGRLIAQFAIESAVLITAGCVAGLLLADWTIKLFVKLIPTAMMWRAPYLKGLAVNSHVLAFTALAALIAAAIFVVIPSVHLLFSRLRGGLAEGSRGSAGVAWRRLGANLVVFELAIAMVLLVGAGLLGKSLVKLLHVDLGFEASHLASTDIAAPQLTYGKDLQQVALGREIVRRFSVLPGITSVGITSVPPVSFNGNTDWIRFVGRPYHGEHNEVNERDVSADYFRTLNARLLRGRYFTASDDAAKPKVAIINQALAEKYFPGEDPVGKRIGDDALTPKSIRQIVGVVDNVREGPLDADIWPAEYLPFEQSPDPYFTVLARTSQAEASVLPAMLATVHKIDPDIGIPDQTTMAERIDNSPSAYLHRSAAWLVGGFAAVALLLGVVGLYGVIAYSVSQRTREVGIRMALGAAHSDVYELILKEAGSLTVRGLAGGLVSSIAAALLIRKLLFGVTSWDVPTLGGVMLILALAALLASYVPARRAASVNPADALRAE